MNRLRQQLNRLVPAVAALFALNIAAPGAGVFYHEHDGGALPHVHSDDGVVAALFAEYAHTHEHGEEHHQHHPHDSAPPQRASAARADPAAQAAFEHDDGPVIGHWHEQQRFQRAVTAQSPLLSIAIAIG